jgi:hypothetical protein
MSGVTLESTSPVQRATLGGILESTSPVRRATLGRILESTNPVRREIGEVSAANEDKEERITVSETTGKMILSAAGDAEGFVLFVACTVR